MSDYIASIIAASVLSGVSSLLSPDKWKKYVGIITGLVVICTILSPLSEMSVYDVFNSFGEVSAESVEADGNLLKANMIKEEMTQRINEDIEKRLLDEFGIKAKSDADIGIDADGKITGVKAVTVTGKGITELAIKRLREVYGVEKISIR